MVIYCMSGMVTIPCVEQRAILNGIINILSEDLSDESLEILNILNVQIVTVLSLMVCKIYMQFLSNLK